MVHVLASYGGCLRLDLRVLLHAGVVEALGAIAHLVLHTSISVVYVLVLALRGHLILLSWLDFAILKRLNSGVVVVLVAFLVDYSLLLGLMLLLDGLVFDGGSDFLCDGGTLRVNFGIA